MRALAIAVVMLLLARGVARAAKGVDGTVNLNTAPAEVLALLPGIGPSKAQSILAYRKRHPFRTVDELARIRGIGRKMVRRWRAHLAVGGPTTAAAAAGPPIAAPVPAPPPPKPIVAPPRPKLALCVKAGPRPRPPRVPRSAGGACWPPP